jgi:hypothetical protein
MTPAEIRACYRLYAAHRRSHEICTFPETIPVMGNAGNPGDLAVLLRLHTGIEGLRREIVQSDPNDYLSLSAVGPLGHLRKMLASFATQLFGRGALVGR